MGDVVGRLFREFAVTLAVTIRHVSAVVSLTLTPMMTARLVKHNPKEKEGRFYKASERMFEGMIAFYGRTLKVVLQFQGITLLIALATLMLTIYLYVIIPKGFFPIQDTGVIQGISQAPPTIGSKAMAQKQQELAKVILQDPAVESLSSTFIGADGTNTTENSGRFSINLKPLGQRDRNASDVIRRLQPKLEQVQGHSPLHVARAEHHRGRPGQPRAVPVRARRPEQRGASRVEQQVRRPELQQLPQLESVATDQQPGGLALAMNIDRITASRLGIAPTTIDNTLYDAYGQRQINTMYTQTNQYHVILEVDPYFRQTPERLSALYIAP